MRVSSSYTHFHNKNEHPTSLFIYLFIKTAHHKLARAWILQRAQLSRQLLFLFLLLLLLFCTHKTEWPPNWYNTTTLIH